jgi:hypothetical protein
MELTEKKGEKIAISPSQTQARWRTSMGLTEKEK